MDEAPAEVPSIREGIDGKVAQKTAKVYSKEDFLIVFASKELGNGQIMNFYKKRILIDEAIESVVDIVAVNGEVRPQNV